MMKLFFAALFLSFNIFAQTTVLIDVREKDEIAKGMLKDARWIPLSELDDKKITQLRQEFRDKNIEVYCRSGARAGKFIERLALATSKVTNLGGYEELQAKRSAP